MVHGEQAIDDIDLRDYPQMVHELLHSLFYQYAQVVMDALRQSLTPVFDNLTLATLPDRNSLKERQLRRNEQIRLLWWPTPDHRNWAHELMIDVMSLAVVGPCYAHWFLSRTAHNTVQPFELVQSHPPFYVRAKGLRDAATKLQFEVENDLSRRLEGWDYYQPTKSNDYLGAADPDIISGVVHTGLELTRRLRLPQYSNDQWEACKLVDNSKAGSLAASDLISAAFHSAQRLSPPDYHAWLDQVISRRLNEP
jgi:hypothetical protein